MNNYEKLNLYPHNIETCKKVKEAYDDGEQIVSIIKATGTGKSYIGLNLSLEHRDEKIVWIVPTLAIKEHIEKTINDNPNLSMERDFSNLEIKTYSSLVNMTKEEIENIPCDLLIVDELHHLGAPVWGERVNTFVETHPDMRVFGMSAYSVRDRGTAYERDMVNPDTEELFSDTVVDRYDLYDAIIDGVLPMPFVKSILTESSKIIEDLREAQKLRRVQGTPIYYEIEKVIDSITKTIHKQEPVKGIVQQSIKEDGKYIYFCPVYSSFGNNDIDTIMKEMERYLQEIFPGKRIVFYKTTSDMGEEGEYNRECFYNDVDLDGKDASDTIRIMFAKNQYNEGVHAPNVDGVFLGRETASDIVALEQIGRGLSVRGDTSLKMEEYDKYTLEELKYMAKSRGIKFDGDVSKEYLIELLIAPTIIDLADNIGFLQELETNLKDRVRERREAGESLTPRQLKILETWSTLDVEQRNLYESLMNLRDQVQAYTWDDWYELAVAYYNHYGDSEIPHYFKTKNGYEYDETGVKLGFWCDNQRQFQDKLSEEKRKKLELIEFIFKNKNDIHWEEMYDLAKIYYEYYGDLEVPQRFKTKNGYEYDEKGVKLGRWCTDQRARQYRLNDKKRHMLCEIGFRFENKNDVEWEKKYRLMVEYFNHYGDSEPPKNFKTKNGYEKVSLECENDEDVVELRSWCDRQRLLKDKLSEEQVEKLDKIDFRFENKYDVDWNLKYKLALAYYKKNGHSNVPSNFKTKNGIDIVPKEHEEDDDVVNLGLWLIEQRKKQDTLDEERKKKLEAIEFKFESSLKDIKWQRNYELLKIYFEHHGHTNVIKTFKTKNGYEYDEEGFSLGSWCSFQRKNQDKLSEERRQKLKEIGFDIKTQKTVMSWDDCYNLVVTYYKHNGNLEMPDKFQTKNGYEYDGDGVWLLNWCNHQRKNQDKLSEERRVKLELLGFRFVKKKENEENKKNLCSEYGIEYVKYEMLKKMSYQEMYAKIMYLIDNGYSLLDGDKLHEIFSMSNENMVLKYMISKEEMILNYYINKKGRSV